MDNSFPQNDLLMTVTIGVVIMLLLAIAFVLFFYFSQQKFQQQQQLVLAREVQHQQLLLAGSIQAQEQERQRLARELHDEIGSKLNVINLGLHHLSKVSVPTASFTQGIAELFEVISNTIDTTRRISHDLLPPTLENFGLATALEELCDQFQLAGDTEVLFQFDNEGDFDASHEVALAFFRVAQELLSNSIKYAKASTISLLLKESEQHLHLDYRDDGVGFKFKQADYKKGLGMNNIESRMRIINASFKFNSKIGEGVLFQANKSKL